MSIISCTAHQVPPRPHVVPAQLGFTKSRTQTLAPRRAASLPHARPPEPPPMTTRLQGRARRMLTLPAHPKPAGATHSKSNPAPSPVTKASRSRMTRGGRLTELPLMYAVRIHLQGRARGEVPPVRPASFVSRTHSRVLSHPPRKSFPLSQTMGDVSWSAARGPSVSRNFGSHSSYAAADGNSTTCRRDRCDKPSATTDNAPCPYLDLHRGDQDVQTEECLRRGRGPGVYRACYSVVQVPVARQTVFARP